MTNSQRLLLSDALDILDATAPERSALVRAVPVLWDSPPQTWAQYDPRTDSLHINPDSELDGAELAATLYHETGHMLRHRGKGPDSLRSLVEEEVIAATEEAQYWDRIGHAEHNTASVDLAHKLARLREGTLAESVTRTYVIMEFAEAIGIV